MKPYTTAREKLDFIIFNVGECNPQAGVRVPIVPVSQVRMIADTLKKMIEVLDGMLAEPKHITPAGIASLRQLIETRVMPLTEGTSAPAKSHLK